MSMWFYQLSESVWPPTSYRIDIWENERWSWPVGKKVAGSANPQPGDTVVFFYSKSCSEPGFYGWAVVLSWEDGKNGDKDRLYFRPVDPSDRLKMHPWGTPEAMQLGDDVRGKMKQATLWLINDDKLKAAISAGVLSWSGTQTSGITTTATAAVTKKGPGTTAPTTA